MAGELIVKREGAVGTLTFANVDKHNAVSYDMWRALPEAVEGLDADDDIRAIVVTGAGDKAFVSGADVAEFRAQRNAEQARRDYNAAVEAGYLALASTDTPTVARIRGICYGGGMGLALACDMRIASEDSRFSLPAARLGLGYSFAGIQRLVAMVGPANAAEIIATARTYTAAEALEIGLVNRVVPPALLDATLADCVGAIVANAPLTVRAAMRAIDESIKAPEERDLAALAALIEACFASDDYREGREAFMQKRPPKFRGR
jgi:enoyl-CoA hydratase/carnithine racemase